jgi:hypothetical protein
LRFWLVVPLVMAALPARIRRTLAFAPVAPNAVTAQFHRSFLILKSDN